MARNFPVDVHIQNFLEQTYDKEDDARLHAWAVNKKLGKEMVSSKQMEVFRKKLQDAAPKPNESLLELRKEKAKSYHRRIFKPEDHLAKLAEKNGARNGTPQNDMFPPPTRERTLLYDGFTKEEKGRYQYLKARTNTGPEEKYAYPILSSWDYGWRLNDVIPPETIHKPQYGRTRIVADTFYIRTGVPDLRFPDYSGNYTASCF